MYAMSMVAANTNIGAEMKTDDMTCEPLKFSLY